MERAALRRARLVSVLGLAAVAAVGAWLALNLEVTASITHFLPGGEGRELAAIAREVSGSDLNRSVTLIVDGPDRVANASAGVEMEARLRESPEVAWARGGPGEEIQRAFYDIYFPRRLAFASDDPTAWAAELADDEALAEMAVALRDRLGSPTGTFLRGIAQEDPLLTFPTHLDRLRAAQVGGLSVEEGRFVTDDGGAVLFLASRASAFDSAAGRRLEAAVDEAFAAVASEGLTLRQSGVHRFAIRSEETIRADIQRISVLSSVGVVLLFLLLFRSPRMMLLSALPIGAGFVVGLAATQLLFGRVHGLSLAFGATLIGVGIDYVAHYVNHHVLAPDAEGPAGTLRRIWPGLALGAATTVAGLLGLAWTSFPGIRELAVLTSVGVLTTLLATRWLVPPWMPAAPRALAVHIWAAALADRALAALRPSRLLWALPLGALLFAAVGLARVGWIDDIRALTTIDATLRAEDEAVRESVSRMDGGRFVVALGGDEEEALSRNDAVYARLRQAQAAGEVARFASLHPFLPSPSVQGANARAAAESKELEARFARALREAGFVPEAFEAFGESLDRVPPPLTYRELAEGPLAPLVTPFRVELEGGRVAFLSFTRGADLEALDARLDGLEGVLVFDQGRFLVETYRGFRTRTLEMVAVGLVLVFGLLWVRYRDVRRALAAGLPALLAAGASLASLGWIGMEANLLHVTALLLVLSMGVDYGVFMVESRHHAEGPGTTMVSLVVACASTMLSFGLLAMSENPALAALGWVTGVGVGLSLLLAPTAWLLLDGEGVEAVTRD